MTQIKPLYNLAVSTHMTKTRHWAFAGSKNQWFNYPLPFKVRQYGKNLNGQTFKGCTSCLVIHFFLEKAKCIIWVTYGATYSSVTDYHHVYEVMSFSSLFQRKNCTFLQAGKAMEESSLKSLFHQTQQKQRFLTTQ